MGAAFSQREAQIRGRGVGGGTWDSSAARSRFQAAWFGVILRHSVNVLCGLVYLSYPPRTTVGVTVAVALIVWGSFRLLTRSMASPVQVWADYALILVVALTIPSTDRRYRRRDVQLVAAGGIRERSFEFRFLSTALAGGVGCGRRLGSVRHWVVSHSGDPLTLDGVLAVLLLRAMRYRHFPAAVGRTCFARLQTWRVSNSQ